MYRNNLFVRAGSILFTLFLAILVGGCATGAAFQKADVPADKALIYVYRPAGLAGAAFTPAISIDNQVKYQLAKGGYFPYHVKPGNVAISISNVGTRSINVDTKAGETYYVKADLVVMGMGVPFIELVGAEKGIEEIKECKLVSNDTERK